MKIGSVSLGCSKNLMDTEVMLSELSKAGYEIVGDESEADIVILNTCGFIKDAKTEAIDNIIDLGWLKKNASLKGLVVCGCLVQRYGDEIMNEMPEVDAVVSVGSIHDIVDAVKAVERGEKYSSLKKPEEAALGGDRIVTTPEYFAYMKIAEGCDNRCTYCAIPDIRGKFRSRPIEELVAEARDMEAIGVKELILIAQDSTRYGIDLYGEYRLDALIREITARTNIPWIRVLYCYPDKITDGLIKEFAENDRLVKYADIPIQHVNETILKKMNRHGGKAAVLDAVARLRAAHPDMTLRSTVIVGFPGETDAQFGELKQFLAETRFDRLGAFEYSKEDGTPAATFSGQVSAKKKHERYDAVMKLQTSIMAKKNEAKVGSVIEVLVEGYDPVSESYYCRSQADAPDIDGKIYITGAGKNAFDQGDLVKVRVIEAMDYDLIAEKIN